MNSLFRKFLFYNLIGLGLIAVIVFSTLQFSQKNLVDERIQEIRNHVLLVENYLSLNNYTLDLIVSLQDIRVTKEINSILENKNVSIVILDKNKNILFDSKGYDLNEDAFQPKGLVALVGTLPYHLAETNGKKEVLGTSTFINKDNFNFRFKDAIPGEDHYFFFKI